MRLDPTKPLETRELIERRLAQREVLAFMDEAIVRGALLHPRFGSVDLTLALPQDASERDRLILERAVRGRAEAILQDPAAIASLESIRRREAADVVLYTLARLHIDRPFALRMEREARNNDNENDEPPAEEVHELAELLVFADALANDYTDPRVAVLVQKWAKKAG